MQVPRPSADLPPLPLPPLPPASSPPEDAALPLPFASFGFESFPIGGHEVDRIGLERPKPYFQVRLAQLRHDGDDDGDARTTKIFGRDGEGPYCKGLIGPI